nr:histidine kinase [Treponemataceae bacterium]
MRARRSSSIRARLLYSFFLTAALMGIIIMYSFLSFNAIAVSITNAYQTNIDLDEFQTALGAVESSMEKYISLRTFESIENYYGWRGRLDTLALQFNVTLSSDPILLLEYKVKRLMESFLEYADKAVYARRGNNVQEYTRNYAAALRVYDYLSDSVNDLNARYFRRNISGYNRLIREMQTIEILSIAILLLVIAVNFLMVYILIDRITGPLVELSRAANEVAEGHFDVDLLGIQSQDEVGNICRAFDRMTVSIREYIDTIKTKAEIENRLRRQEMEMRELYKDAQLKTLQSQINPHFLFNTLNAGAQLAMMEGADDTCTFIEKTADFF